MSHVPLRNRGTSAAAIAEHPDSGFSASGEGMWSRRQAAHVPTPMMSNRTPKRAGRHTLKQLIAETAGALAHMRGRLAGMDDHDPALPKLLENLDRKASFLARLRAEAAGEGR